jgi:hypothetical protein
MPHTELVNLQTRQRQSAELAAASGDVSVRIAHQKMADGYAEQIATLMHKRLA